MEDAIKNLLNIDTALKDMYQQDFTEMAYACRGIRSILSSSVANKLLEDYIGGVPGSEGRVVELLSDLLPHIYVGRTFNARKKTDGYMDYLREAIGEESSQELEKLSNQALDLLNNFGNIVPESVLEKAITLSRPAEGNFHNYV